HLHGRLTLAAELVREIGRDFDPDFAAARSQRVLKGVVACDRVDNAERAGVFERTDQPLALLSPIQIQNDCADVLDLGVDRVTEDRELEYRDQKRENKSAALAADVRELLEENGQETVHGPI